MKTNLLKNWKNAVIKKFCPKPFRREDISKAVEIFEGLMPDGYFEIKQVYITKAGHQKSNLSYNRWLHFLLCQYRIGAISHVLEISQVLYYFNTTKYQLYLNDKLFSKGHIRKNFFEGYYFELYIAFIFLTNNVETYLEYDDPTVEGDKPLDCYLKIDNEEYIVECKFLASKDKHVKALDTTLNMQKEFTKRRQIIVESSDIDPRDLDICGYYIFDNELNDAQNYFSKKLKEHYHNTKNNVDDQPAFKLDLPKGLLIEKYIEGLFENYPLSHAELAVKFKFTTHLTRTDFVLKDPAEEIVERIKKSGITAKKEQHKRSKIKNKIIILGINNGFNAVPPLNLDFFQRYKKRFKDRLDENMMVLFVIKNIINDEPLDIYTYAISKDNPKLEEKFNSLNWYLGTKKY